MNTPMPIGRASVAAPALRPHERLMRSALVARLQRISGGRVELEHGADLSFFGRSTPECPLAARVRVQDPRFYADVALGGSVGAAEAYARGAWTCNDLTALARILLRNVEVMDGMETGLARLSAPLRLALHWLNRNTRHGSRRNIAAHYDLGNDLFELMLDETLMYSSAIFERADMPLAEASRAKLDRVCRKLELSPRDHVLEIGTGWGGFALHAAANYGCRVTSTTISRNQYELALERIRAAGLAERVTLLLEDYRDLGGKYDKIVSIEMIEALGHQYYETFFAQCARLLAPEGQMLLQAITIADQRYERARDEVDFIKRFIFPGSCIPSITALVAAATWSSDFKLFHLEDIGPHYATTLQRWRENVLASLGRLRSFGYSDEFLRMWEFYLCYCEAGFAERALGDAQMLMVRPGCRRAALLPAL